MQHSTTPPIEAQPVTYMKIEYYWYDHVILAGAILLALVLCWAVLSGAFGAIIL